jgi:hypothetical protein
MKHRAFTRIQIEKVFRWVWVFTPFLLSCSNPLGSSPTAQSNFLAQPNSNYCAGAALTNSPYAGGSGTSANPYMICTTTQLSALAANSTDWGLQFKLMANISLASTAFTMIGAPSPFNGVFDGNGYIISNLSLTSNSANFLGLFGHIGSAGVVKNLGVELSSVTTSNSNAPIGVFAGLNDGTITHCHSTGSVNANSYYAGGLVGENTGTISQSYSQASVQNLNTGSGGLVGFHSSGSITNCYATGNITNGASYAGGLVGIIGGGSVSYSYSTGTVVMIGGTGGFIGSGTSTHSFWDTQTSARPTSSGAETGLSTSLMQTASTFTSAGWDTTIWNIQNGQYPTLK